MSVFKDELLKMYPDDPRAKKLAASTWLLGDFLVHAGYKPPVYEVDVLVHGHCHQKSLFGTKGDQLLLEQMGARARFLDSGCCGMAGSFGFNPDHVEISKAIGEEVLLPAVRAQSPDTCILTNGFSCREQIRQGTGREVVHLAELLQRAHRHAARSRAAEPSVNPSASILHSH
jgi:Fe-S oxidoreductase